MHAGTLADFSKSFAELLWCIWFPGDHLLGNVVLFLNTLSLFAKLIISHVDFVRIR